MSSAAGQWRFEVWIADEGCENPVGVHVVVARSFPGRENFSPYLRVALAFAA
ncbi:MULTISPECIES: hypothetical protein [unclassified Amycolatopsis]|uniref:hypothetical protein n=1 Tax=unclassified Amycolatopsis TaxID=2618356 RepID=UPI001315079B|nr:MULTISPECIES: hypothetical protein [unclassified Amycolatopsis]